MVKAQEYVNNLEGGLNLAKFVNLEQIDLSNNQITKLILGNNAKLRKLIISNKKLSQLKKKLGKKNNRWEEKNASFQIFLKLKSRERERERESKQNLPRHSHSREVKYPTIFS